MNKVFFNGISETLARTTGVPNGRADVNLPFQNVGDFTTKEITQRYICYADAPALELGSPLDTATATSCGVSAEDYFFVEQSSPRSIGADIVEVERTFVNVPQPQTLYSSGMQTLPAHSFHVGNKISDVFKPDEEVLSSISYNNVGQVILGVNVGLEFAKKACFVSYSLYDAQVSITKPVLGGGAYVYVGDDGIALWLTSFFSYVVAAEGTHVVSLRSATSSTEFFSYRITWGVSGIFDFCLPGQNVCVKNCIIKKTNHFLRLTEEALLNLDFEEPYLADWAGTLNASQLADWAYRTAHRLPILYERPSLSRWKGDIYQLSRTYIINTYSLKDLNDDIITEIESDDVEV